MDGSDQAAVARVRAGDEDAFRVLVERHSRQLFRLAYRMTGNEQDAEDVVQEAFLRAYRQVGRFEARSSVGTWLYRIAANCAIDLMRRRPHREVAPRAAQDDGEDDPPVSAAPDPERLAASAALRHRVASALDRLSAMERTAFVLRHFEGQSIEEIGRVLGARTSATKHTIFRAVQKMRRALEPLVQS